MAVLEELVLHHYVLNRDPIRLASRQVQLEQRCDRLGILPLLNFLVEAEIGHDYRRRPRDTRITVYEHFLLLVVDHVVEILASLENTQVVLVLICVVHLEVLGKEDAAVLQEFEGVEPLN